MLIRLIDNAELDQIEELWCELKRCKLKEIHQSLTTDFHQHYIDTTFAGCKAELLSRDGLAVFVASVDECDIGFCVVSVSANKATLSPNTMPKATGTIESLFVDTSNRSAGLGSALCNKGIEWLRKQGAEDIQLSVGQGNEAVVEFYRKLGFRQRAVTMQLF